MRLKRRDLAQKSHKESSTVLKMRQNPQTSFKRKFFFVPFVSSLVSVASLLPDTLPCPWNLFCTSNPHFLSPFALR